MNYKNFEFWNKEKLWKLRTEICLNSIFYCDYENSFDIPKKTCFNFFDGFLEDCFIIEEENGNHLVGCEYIFTKYDNMEALWNYFCSLEFPFGE